MRTALAFLMAFLFFAACGKKTLAPLPQPPAPPSEHPSIPQTMPAEVHHHHAEHKEVKIPTPLVLLQESPLDVAPGCSNSKCELLLLYRDRLDVLIWQTGQVQSIRFAPAFLSAVKSRAPSGKILPFAQGYIVLSNCLSNPLYFSSDFHVPPGVFTDKPEWLPLPQPGFNWFTLQDGHFYDFERDSNTAFAAVDTNDHLNVAQAGKLLTSAEKVGSKLCISSTAIYTSSPTLSSDPDAILKFDPASLKQISSRPVDGQILGLTLSDLNLDGEMELLVTLREARGILIDVQEPF